MASKPPTGQETTILQVFVFKEGRFFGTECFAQGTIILGRSPDVDLQLDDDITSRSHASVEVSAEGLILEDLASSNGTYVNGEPVERCYLSARDEVSIGSFTLKFKLLSRSKPKARFRDETRVVDRDQTEVVAEQSLHADGARPQPEQPRFDETEVVKADSLRAVRDNQEPVREVADRRLEIAAALDDELADGPGFDSSATERQSRPAEMAAPAASAADFESTTIAPEPAGRVDSQVPLHDRSTRWLTPEPTAGPALELADQLEPEPRYAPRPEPAPIGRLVSAPASAPSAPVQEWPTEAEPGAGLPGGFPGMAPEPVSEFGPPAVSADDFEDDGEEEDDQRDFVEPFSLLNNLIRENFAEPQVPTESKPVMEVIGYTSDKEVMGVEQLARGRKHRVGPARFVLAHYNDRAAGRILFNDEFSGGVISGGQTIPLDDLKSAANQVGRKGGKPIYGYKLLKGDYANVIHSGGGSFVRFVNPPRIPPARFQFRVDPLDLKIFGGSFFGLALVILLLGIFATKKDASASTDEDRFAKVDLKDLQMEKPEEEIEIPLDQLPEPDKKEEEKVEEQKEEEKPKEEPKKKSKKKPKKSAKSAGDDKPDTGGGAGMMAALGNLNQQKPTRNIVAAVTNLDAVRTPGASRYKVSGLVTKLPTSSVVTSSSKGVGVKGGIELLRGGKGKGGLAGLGPGALTGGKTGARGVGGVVFKAPKRSMKVRGSLSREAIAAVVRKHLKEIQYCYERNLMLNPKLSGKLVMEWTISTSGSVSVVKTQQNTMATPAVAMCVSASIKKWVFPKPKGGIVVVSYPFIFNSIGF